MESRYPKRTRTVLGSDPLQRRHRAGVEESVSDQVCADLSAEAKFPVLSSYCVLSTMQSLFSHGAVTA